jgi:hypothetical protein
MSYRLETLVRVLLAATAVVGVFFAPWWVPALCMLLLSLRYPAWEVPLIGLLMDLVWLPGAHVALPLYMIFGIVVVWAASPLRRQLLL